MAQPVEPAPESSQAPVQTTTAGASKSAHGDYTMSTSVSSMADLKAKAPKVAEAMMMGIAQNIVNRMRKHAERLKKLMRDSTKRH